MPKSVYTDAYSTMVDMLVRRRHERGLTQVQLASLLGKPQSFISKIEQGQRRVDVIEFCAIAQALGFQPERLFGELLRSLPSKLPI